LSKPGRRCKAGADASVSLGGLRRNDKARFSELSLVPGGDMLPPAEKGFGTRLIERACSYELEGEVELEYAPAGLRCRVVFPLT